MPLTPLEIQNKEFSTKMRGYDQDEVNEFLDQIIRDYELVMRQNKEIEEELKIKNVKLSKFEDMQEALNRSILVAQEAADRLIENTDREVEVMKIEAEGYAEKVREEADSYVSETEKEIDDYAVNIQEEADNNADELLKEAVAKARKIEDETEALRKQSRVFRQRLQLLIESQLNLLAKEDWDNLLAEDPIESSIIETIMDVEKKLEGKKADISGNEMNEAEVEAIELNAEGSIDETVAIEEEEHYNDLSEQSDDQEEGTMPAIELPESE